MKSAEHRIVDEAVEQNFSKNIPTKPWITCNCQHLTLARLISLALLPFENLRQVIVIIALRDKASEEKDMQLPSPPPPLRPALQKDFPINPEGSLISKLVFVMNLGSFCLLASRVGGQFKPLSAIESTP